jgi:hypothetical protein
MKKLHHSLTLKASADLIQYWLKYPAEAPGDINLPKINNLLQNANNLKNMSKWVAATDDLDDVVVDNNLVEWIVERISDATSFQHFAYCGSMGDLVDSGAVVRKYDGYCWDCDPNLKWYEEIADLSCADARYNPECGVLPSDFLVQSPGSKMISGETDWDDQVYPSALELAQFYFGGATKYKSIDGIDSPNALKCLSFAIHLLQDMSNPHHILCTIELGHAEYEKECLHNWKKLIYGDKSQETKQKHIENWISSEVKRHLNVSFNVLDPSKPCYDLGRLALEQTEKRLTHDGRGVRPANKVETKELTVLAIASTLKALNLYV